MFEELVERALGKLTGLRAWLHAGCAVPLPVGSRCADVA